jgi:hypothetical protein
MWRQIALAVSVLVALRVLLYAAVPRELSTLTTTSAMAAAPVGAMRKVAKVRVLDEWALQIRHVVSYSSAWCQSSAIDTVGAYC